MAWTDKEEILEGNYNIAKVLNTFFSNIVSNLNIVEYTNYEPLANNISDPVLKCVVKYRSHPSILAIGENVTSTQAIFFFKGEWWKILR